MRRLVVAALVTGLGVVLQAPAAGAHPLGSFTVNTAAHVRVGVHELAVDHVVDLAEIPAFRVSDDIERDGRAVWAAAQCAAVAAAIDLRANGAPVALSVKTVDLSFPPGQAGLSTLRLECGLVSGRLPSTASVTITDGAFAGKAGWREITAEGDGTTLRASDVPVTSPSARLTDYPDGAPMVVRTASLTATPGGGAANDRGDAVIRLLPRGADQASRSFTELVARREVTIPFVLVALLLAAALGSLHALAPGHGKTVMAAYVIGRRGTTRQALAIGGTVAVTHTAGVLAIGIGLWVSDAIAPERLVPVLGVVSGLLLAVVGSGLLRRALARRGLAVGHHHGHHHHHHDHDHDHHDHDHHDHHHAEAPRRWSLVGLGVAGGLVPSPSALVVLLGALALGRAWLGVALVLAYGVGMACCLVGAGLLLARLGGAVERRLVHSAAASALLGRALPVATAAVIVLVGVTVAARAAGQL